MQTTPFRHITYHNDGGHKFTVKVGEHTKVFTTTENIPIRKAIEFAAKFRDSLTRDSSMVEIAREYGAIDSYAEKLEADLIPIKIPTQHKSTTQKQNRTVTQVLGSLTPIKPNPKSKALKNSHWIAKLPNKYFKKMAQPHYKYPRLPASCNPTINTISKRDYVIFTVAYAIDDKPTKRAFYVASTTQFTLARYRMVRHVAVSFRLEYLSAVAERRPMDLEAFEHWPETIANGTFKWPFTGTVPIKLPKVKPARRKAKAEVCAGNIAELLADNEQSISDTLKKKIADIISEEYRRTK